MKTRLAILGLGFVLAGHALAQTCTNFINQGRAALAARNMTNACLSFSNAVVQCPNDPAANVFYAATRLFYLVSKPPMDSFLTRLGVSTTDRNIYDWQATAPQDTNGLYVPPPGVNAREGALLMRTNVLPEITAAAANLAKVTQMDFLLNLTSNETATIAVTVDYGDVLLCRALLHVAEYLGYTVNSWNLDAQLTAIKALYNATNRHFNIQRLLADPPQLFTFATTADLAAARTALTNAMDLYLQASVFIRSRPLTVTRLFNWDPEMAEDEYKFRLLLADLKTSLQGRTVLRVETNLTVYLAKAFDGSKAPRAMFPAFTNDLFIEGTLPDPTFGGLIQGVSRQKVEEGLTNVLNMKSPDARFWGLVKGQWLIQSGTGTPVLDGPIPYRSYVFVEPSAPDAVTNASLRLPSGTPFPFPLKLAAYDGSWSSSQSYSNKASLDAAVPPGTYQLTIATLHDGTRTLPLYAPPDAYPNTPRISNYTAAQEINPNQDFVLTWDAFAGGTTNDYVSLAMYSSGLKVFQTPDEPWKDGALNGLSNSVRIPAYTLGGGSNFYAKLMFLKATSVDRTSFPAAMGVVGYFKTTEFPLRIVDVTEYAVLKGQRFVQTNSNPPALEEFFPFELRAFARPSGWETLTNATLRLPGGVVKTNPYPDYEGFDLHDEFDTLGDLDSAYPNGTYQYTLDTRNEGRKTLSLSLTGNTYPSTPRISNYAAAQTIDGTQDFTLRWDAFAGGTVNDHIQVMIGDGGSYPAMENYSQYGYAVYTPDYGEPGALNGTATSILIPAFSLKANQSYNGYLVFGKATQVDRTSYPGALGYAGYFKVTGFQIHATNGLPTVDLAATDLSFSDTPTAGQRIQVSYTVANQGNKRTDSGRSYSLYLSTNSVFSTQDVLLDQYYDYQAMAGGSSITQNRSVVLPWTGAGTYYLHLIIQYWGQESNLANNQRSVSLQLAAATFPFCSAQTVVLSGNNPSLQFDAPAGQRLFVTVQPAASASMPSAVLTRGGLTVASSSGYGDKLLVVNNPVAGTYTLTFQGSASGQAVIRACPTLPTATLDELFVGTIQRSGGYDWAQLDAPAGLGGLQLMLETVGTSSSLEVWRDNIAGSAQWAAYGSGAQAARVTIANPVAGRYYLRVYDSGWVSGNRATRDYSILAHALAAPVVLDNSTVRAVIDPNRGCVTSLFFKQGSNVELIDSSAGRYLLDFGSQDPNLSRFLTNGWQVIRSNVMSSQLTLSLVHPSGFSNQLSLAWDASQVEVRCDITAPEGLIINNNIKPGNGFFSGSDRWAVPAAGGVQQGAFTYPGYYSFTKLYPTGAAQWAEPPQGWMAFWNDSVNEVHGFTFSPGYQLQVANGARTELLFAIPAGQSSISFHVRKPKPTPPYGGIEIITTRPVLALNKQVDRVFAAPGRELTYTLTVANPSPVPATGLVLSDTLPAEVTLVGGSITGGGTYDAGPRRITWNFSSLNATSSLGAVTFRATLAGGLSDGTVVVNPAQVVATEQPVPRLASATTIVGGPVITSLTPTNGSNKGSVTLTITGTNLDANASVRLTKSGQGDIVGTGVSGSQAGDTLTATMNLTSRQEGWWNLLVSNPDGGSATKPDAFYIQAATNAEVVLTLTGPAQVRPQRPATFSAVLDNKTGNDLANVAVRVTTRPVSSGSSTLLYTNLLSLLPPGQKSLLFEAVFPTEGCWWLDGIVRPADTNVIPRDSSIEVCAVVPIDPNLKSPSAGSGTAAFVRPGIPMPYTIYFENKSNALAGVQDMRITDTLPPELDWSTFAFARMQLGNHTVDVPPGRQSYTTTVDFRPEMPVVVQVQCQFNRTNGQAQWYFKGVDPYTGTWADNGFLPPDTAAVAPAGEGWVSFNIQSRTNLASGTLLRNKATIDFEDGIPPAPLDTPLAENTIDATAPTSAVAPLPLYAQPVFTVAWQGADNSGGSGAQDYTIYVSDNGGPFTVWKLNTTGTSASYTGMVNRAYAFYSVARDGAGNVEAVPMTADASTTVSTNTFSMTFSLAKGYNLLAAPFSGTGLTTAEQLAQAIANCTGVWKWEPASQTWSGHPKGGPNNFTLTDGGAYLVSVTGASSFTPSGLWAAPVFALKKGYNLVSLSNSKPGITTAEQLTQSIPSCTGVWKWDAATQTWSGHPKGGPNNFSVEVGRAYLVSVTADGNW